MVGGGWYTAGVYGVRGCLVELATRHYLASYIDTACIYVCCCMLYAMHGSWLFVATHGWGGVGAGWMLWDWLALLAAGSL